MVKSPEILFIILCLVINYLAYPQDCLNAHSHNDYNRERPLYQALENNFRSVEADIFLSGGQLVVAHSVGEIDSTRTLEALYLEPLSKLIANNKLVCSPIYLFIDIKEDGKAVYPVLCKMLAKYADMLTGYNGERIYKKDVSIIISGDRPLEEIINDTTRYAAIDGRLSDVNKPSYFFPIISDNWFNVSSCLEKYYSNVTTETGLKELSENIRNSGKLFRIWGAPDNEKSWQIQYNAGVSLINTDNINGLRQFLIKNK